MRYREARHARLVAMKDGSLAFFSSYDPMLVAALKADIPTAARRWNPREKYWQVTSRYASVCTELAKKYLNVDVVVPNVTTSAAQSVSRLIKLEYLGVPRDRGGDEPSTYGYVGGEWSVLFPLSVLRGWFDVGDIRPGSAQTFYGMLGIRKGAVAIEIKKAYRKAARRWHPDVSSDPDATAQFRRVQQAYEILKDESKRARYDAGLMLEASLRGQSRTLRADAWRPPLRCGWLMVDGTEALGRLTVTRIRQWQDIQDSRGLILVTFWPRGADTFASRWV